MPRKSFMDHDQLLEDLKQSYGCNITSADIRGFCAANGFNYQTITNHIDKYKVSRGCWNLEITPEKIQEIERVFNDKSADKIDMYKNLVPEKDDLFVSHGNFSTIKSVIKSQLFFPIFITGLSGNGKTYFVEQACAHLGRELVRINLTIETDEDDLIGGFRLIDGNTVWQDGPVIEAMKRGSILLLDEIDLSSNKIMCLQSIMEGAGYYVKKVNKFISPAPGFNIIATANTKGKGSEDGRFAGTNILNEAFLERFPITIEQNYPTPSIEIKILQKLGKSLNINDNDFYKCLVDWADITRKTFEDGGIDELISTRRLIHIIKSYSIFNDKTKAIKICINRFDADTRQGFLELYDKVDLNFDMDEKSPEENNT